MKKYLSLRIWSMSEVVLGLFTSMVLLSLAWVIPTEVFSPNGAIGGIFGAVVLRHFALHGWTLLRGTVLQRVVLTVFWLLSVLVGGVVATLAGL